MTKRFFPLLLFGIACSLSSYAQTTPLLQRATISSGSRDDKQCTATVGEAVVGFKNSTTGGSLSIGAQPGDGGTSPTKDVFQKASVDVYPNPTTDWVTLDIEQSSANEFSLTVTDVLGRVVHNVQGLSAGLHLFSLQTLPAGSYIVVLRDKNGVIHYSAPIVKSNK